MRRSDPVHLRDRGSPGSTPEAAAAAPAPRPRGLKGSAAARRLAYALSLLAAAAGASLALASAMSASGPLPSSTGAPAMGAYSAEFDCTLCHFSAGNNLNTPGGAVEVFGLPSTYLPGQTYPLTVRLHSDSTIASPSRKWGFELTALRTSDGRSCGTFLLPDADTLQIVAGTAPFLSRSYVEHTLLGTRASLAGPVTWGFSWRAPNPHEGTVYFFCAGIAANGDLDLTGDFVFTTVDSVHVDATPVRALTWGALKARYR